MFLTTKFGLLVNKCCNRVREYWRHKTFTYKKKFYALKKNSIGLQYISHFTPDLLKFMQISQTHPPQKNSIKIDTILKDQTSVIFKGGGKKRIHTEIQLTRSRQLSWKRSVVLVSIATRGEAAEYGISPLCIQQVSAF